MRVPINDLSRSWQATDPDVQTAITRVAASGWYVHGPEHGAFEQELAQFVGLPHAVGVASGTDALELALQAVGCRSGGIVMVAANAGGYASVAAAKLGSHVIYADVDQSSLLMTPQSVKRCMGPGLDAVVVTHLYGNVADAQGIAQLCHEHGVPVIEDCAQAIGARSAGQHVGSWGDAATLSFYPTKNLGGLGDGGAVITSRSDIGATVAELRQYGWSHRYRIDRPGGSNSRLDEIQAAVLRVGLRRLNDRNRARERVLSQYSAALESSPIQLARSREGGVHHLAVLILPTGASRASARELFANMGIATDIHYPIPDHRQAGLPPPAWETDLAVTESASERILSIPCFPELTPDEVEWVCQGLNRLTRSLVT